jgi:hypothetical protein
VPDPTIFATAFNKHRFYLFTKNEPADHDGSDFNLGRDVFNERPQEDDIRVVSGGVKVRGSKLDRRFFYLSSYAIFLFRGSRGCGKGAEGLGDFLIFTRVSEKVGHRKAGGFFAIVIRSTHENPTGRSASQVSHHPHHQG